MKTTVEVPDQLYRRIKARAALRGQSVKAFFLDALRAKLAEESTEPPGKTGWRAAFGTARAEDVAKVQRIIDEEFSRIDPEGWE
jgi:plasmid stability protein